MTPYQMMEEVDAAQERHSDLMDKYLRKSGWEHVCNTPGSYWLWSKEIDGKNYMCPMTTAYSVQKELDFREMNKPHDYQHDEKAKACAVCGFCMDEFESPHQSIGGEH